MDAPADARQEVLPARDAGGPPRRHPHQSSGKDGVAVATGRLIANLHGPRLPVEQRPVLFDQQRDNGEVVLVFWAIREELGDSIGRRLRRDTP